MKAWESRFDKTNGVGPCCATEGSSKSLLFLVLTFTMITAFTLVFGSVVMHLVDMIEDLESRVDELQETVNQYETRIFGLKKALVRCNVTLAGL